MEPNFESPLVINSGNHEFVGSQRKTEKGGGIEIPLVSTPQKDYIVNSVNLLNRIYNHDLDGIRILLANKLVDVNEGDENEETPLMVASRTGDVDIVELLLSYEANVNAEDDDGWTALLNATKEGHLPIVKILVQQGAKLEQRDVGGWTAITWASYKGRDSITELLLKRGAKSNVKGLYSISPLAWAAGRGHLNVVKLLLEGGAKPNTVDKYGTTPLIWASRNGHESIVELLLSKGATADAVGMSNWTALLVATEGKHTKVVQKLLTVPSLNLNARNKDGMTALMVASKEGSSTIVHELLRKGPHINIQDHKGDTPLIHAVKGSHIEIVRALLDKFADVELTDEDNRTALYWAAEKNALEVIRYLVHSNANVDEQTKDGDTPLMRAARNHNGAVVDFLVSSKAKVHLADKVGDTALHIAIRARSKGVTESLLRNPKHSRLLYKPNKAGETPYQLDMKSESTSVLQVIFGARYLNPQLSATMAGFDLYSNALADILSEPTLSTPITVGLYAKWGSGKSFLLSRLEEDLRAFAHQSPDPLLDFSPLLFFLIFIPSLVFGLLLGFAFDKWYWGVIGGFGLILLCYIILFVIWIGCARYDWDWAYDTSVFLAKRLNRLCLLSRVIFFHPPLVLDQDSSSGRHNISNMGSAVNFLFTDYTRLTSLGGETSLSMMLATLGDAIEKEYGLLTSRLFPVVKTNQSSSVSRAKTVCCLPTYLFVFLFLIILIATVCLVGFRLNHASHPIGVAPKTTLSPRTNTIFSSLTTESLSKLLSPISQENDTFSSSEEDEDDSEEDDDEEDELSAGNMFDDDDDWPWYDTLLIILISLLLAFVLATLPKWWRFISALGSSSKGRILRSSSHLDAIKMEGFMQKLQNEVHLMSELVSTCDAFQATQTRLVVIFDGLDSCDPERILQLLDTINILFSKSRAPFITVLAIDPHIVIRGIEQNLHPNLFTDATINGFDYLRNVVHLPLFIQNSRFGKAKEEQQNQRKKQVNVKEKNKSKHSQSPAGSYVGLHRKGSRMSLMSVPGEDGSGARKKIITKYSANGNIIKDDASVVSFADGDKGKKGKSANFDISKIIMKHDYFSDINPRSIRRLINIVAIQARLLRAHEMEFEWHRLVSWVNITEQWPYRASFLIVFAEENDASLEDKATLKSIYDKVFNKLTANDPLLQIDRNFKKLEFTLSHSPVLTIGDMRKFLPFTINLDPYLCKHITSNLSESLPATAEASQGFNPGRDYNPYSKITDATSRLGILDSDARLHEAMKQQQMQQQSLHPIQQPSIATAFQQRRISTPYCSAPRVVEVTSSYQHLPAFCVRGPTPVMREDLIATLSAADIAVQVSQIPGLASEMTPNYIRVFTENNINGQVLQSCDIGELRPLLAMNFGDWHLFKAWLSRLRESPTSPATAIVAAPSKSAVVRHPVTSVASAPPPSRYSTSFTSQGITSITESPPHQPHQHEEIFSTADRSIAAAESAAAAKSFTTTATAAGFSTAAAMLPSGMDEVLTIEYGNTDQHLPRFSSSKPKTATTFSTMTASPTMTSTVESEVSSPTLISPPTKTTNGLTMQIFPLSVADPKGPIAMSYSAPVIPSLFSPPLPSSSQPGSVISAGSTSTSGHPASLTSAAVAPQLSTAAYASASGLPLSNAPSTPRFTTMKSTPPPETPSSAMRNIEMRDLTGYSGQTASDLAPGFFGQAVDLTNVSAGSGLILKHPSAAPSSYEEAESMEEMQFLSGFMPRDSEDDDDEDEEDDDHSTEEQLAPQLIRSVSGTSLPSLADSQSSIPSSLRSSFRQLRYGSPFRLFTRSQNNSNGNDNGVDGASSATPSSRATAGSGVDSDSFVSDWTTETEPDPQYETVIHRTAPPDRQVYPRMTDLFSAPGPPSEDAASPLPNTGGERGGEESNNGGEESNNGGEEEEEKEESGQKELSGAMSFAAAETTDDQAFLIDEAQDSTLIHRSSLLDKATSAVLRASGGSSSQSSPHSSRQSMTGGGAGGGMSPPLPACLRSDEDKEDVEFFLNDADDAKTPSDDSKSSPTNLTKEMWL